MFYKPFSVLNQKENHIGTEDDMAIDFPMKEFRDGSFNKMEVDDEPSLSMTP